MFKLIAHTGEWVELYVSNHASAALRSYMPPSSVFEGDDDGVVVSEITRLDLGSERRPRVVVLIVDAETSVDAISIHTHLRLDLGDDFDALIAEPGFDPKSETYRRIFRVCRKLDLQIRGKESADDARSPGWPLLRRQGIGVPATVIGISAAVIVLVVVGFVQWQENYADEGWKQEFEDRLNRIETTEVNFGDEVNSRLTIIERELHGADGRVAEIIGTSSTNWNSLRRKVDNWNNDLNDVRNRIAKWEDGEERRAEESDRRIGAFVQRLSAVEKRVAVLDESIEGIQKKMDESQDMDRAPQVGTTTIAAGGGGGKDEEMEGVQRSKEEASGEFAGSVRATICRITDSADLTVIIRGVQGILVEETYLLSHEIDGNWGDKSKGAFELWATAERVCEEYIERAEQVEKIWKCMCTSWEVVRENALDTSQGRRKWSGER